MTFTGLLGAIHDSSFDVSRPVSDDIKVRPSQSPTCRDPHAVGATIIVSGVQSLMAHGNSARGDVAWEWVGWGRCVVVAGQP